LKILFGWGERGKPLAALKKRHTLGELTYKALRKAIVTRRLPAGTHLVVDRLCEELKVSRTPVKQALAMLEREGLVVTSPHRGTYVVTVTKDDIEEIYSLREVIEGLAARLAAETITSQDLRRLQVLVQDGKKALEAKDFDAYAEIDLEFHRLIRRASGNQRLQRIMESLDGQVRILINTSSAVPGRGKASISEHRRVVAALRARDPAAAEAAMRKHVANAREALLAHWVDGRSRPELEDERAAS